MAKIVGRRGETPRLSEAIQFVENDVGAGFGGVAAAWVDAILWRKEDWGVEVCVRRKPTKSVS